MSGKTRLLIAQLAFGFVALFALLVIGVQIFGMGHINPDEILPWAYTAAVGLAGMLVCLFIRLGITLRQIEKKLD